MQTKDRIIIGAGIYGLYAALYLARRGKVESILVLEREGAAFSRATYVNQARVHMGYHYPRSLSTASRSAHYFNRFVDEYSFCINGSFEQIYAISSQFSWTSAGQFRKFCEAARIPCCEVSASRYFNADTVEAAFLTEEYTYDAALLKEYFLEELSRCSNVEICYGVKPERIEKRASVFELVCSDGNTYQTPFLLNATYAATNILSDMVGMELFRIKYELCEIILCHVEGELEKCGLTVMDGPFFSIMPFGKTGRHSLTSVTFTPHTTSYDPLPTFRCQREHPGCTPGNLADCNVCPAHPDSAWPYMSALARKYMRPEYRFEYEKSLYSIKPILTETELDDSRPTVIRTLCMEPVYIAVLSGKINTVFDLDEVLDHA